MMRGLRGFTPSPLMLLLILSLAICSSVSEARHHDSKVPSAEIEGTVFCDTCFQDESTKGTHYISGATVAVDCDEGTSRPAFHQEVQTDKQGKFKVQLPFSVSKHVREIQGCNVKLVKSSEPYCAVASTATSTAIHLKERKRGKHIFSAGFFSFKPLKQPGLCNQQPSITKGSLQALLPGLPSLPIPTPSLPLVPDLPTPSLPLPTLPLPQLPPLPPLPPLPGLPGLPTVPSKTSPDQNPTDEKFFFPPIVGGTPTLPNPLQPAPLLPNPLQPPAAPLIPNPFQPPSPPSLLPPVPQLPPLPVPPLPNLPVPPLPNLPVPLPPLPNLPVPPVPQLPVPLPPLPNLPLPPVVPGLTPTPAAPTPPASSIPLPPVQLPPLSPLVPGIPLPPAKKASP